MLFRCLETVCLAMIATVICGSTLLSAAVETPTDLKPIGGKWYVTPGDKPVYYYRDADRYVDLFSYHAKDSNKDGIDNVRISHDSQCLIIRSQGYPNHPTAKFPNSGNPNTITVQDFTFRLPLEPKLAQKVTRVPMGPIGMALNGVVFFNPFEAGGMNAVEGYSEVWLDSCCGHPQQHGVYHYHKYPSCVKSPFPDDGKQHSPVLGFAWDGFPIYGPYEEAGVMAKDLKGSSALDVCNGHQDKVRGYHYHVTPGRFPYTIGGYAGVPEPSNSRELRRGGEAGAIQDNSSGQSHLERVITSVKPGNASRGKKHTIQIQLAPANARFGNIPMSKPDWVQIGPYEATRIERTGNNLSVEIDIPADAAVGVLLDCHIEFENAGRGTLVFKANDAFRVVE
jgi:YHYH protein